jgi:tRNA(Arg) A34 adenosine deaminase TadA
VRCRAAERSAGCKLTALDHERFLRLSFDVAKRARANGNHPFGSVLVSAAGDVLLEVENGFLPDRDMTGHAERLLATQAGKQFTAETLRESTLYSSAEPCAMCVGAIYWAGIGRVVYGLSEHRLKAITGAHLENPTLDLPCRTVFAAGRRQVEVIGPLLEDEAAVLHEDFWRASA